MSTVKTTYLQHPSSSTPNITLDANGTVNNAGGQSLAPAYRNLIINGAVTVSQRGTNFTTGFSADMWRVTNPISRLSGGQYAVAPTGSGFSKCFYAFITSGYTPGASSDIWGVYNKIEGQNISHLMWGTANAKTVTLSFWVYSYAAGTQCVSIQNGALNRSYVATYTINSATTWEYKTVTIPGDTAGTWATDNTAGMSICFSMGSGSGATTSANTWTAGNYVRTTGSLNPIETTNSAIALTGVQLEVGTVATSFEFEPYETTLRKCQRYFQKYDWAAGAGVTVGMVYPTNNVHAVIPLVTLMRTSPTSGSVSTSGTFYGLDAGNTGRGVSAITINTCSPTTISLDFTGLFNLGAGYACFIGASTSCSMSVSADL